METLLQFAGKQYTKFFLKVLSVLILMLPSLLSLLILILPVQGLNAQGISLTNTKADEFATMSQIMRFCAICIGVIVAFGFACYLSFKSKNDISKLNRSSV